MAKRYIDLWPICADALKRYANEVREMQFPAEINTFKINDDEFQKFTDYLKNNNNKT
jgi:ketopantoate hydroxymethyltransferase